MARQIVDLRTVPEKYGVTRTQQTAQSISEILQTIGQAEQKRRERQTLDRITRAISGGATTVEAIAAAAGQGPQFSAGIPGMLQRFGGRFQPSPGAGMQNIQQAIIGAKLQEALRDPLERRVKEAQLKSTKALTKSRKAQARAEPSANQRRDAEIWLRLADDALQQHLYTEDPTEAKKLLQKSKEHRRKAEDILTKIAEKRPRKQPSLRKPRPGETDEQVRTRLGITGYKPPITEGELDISTKGKVPLDVLATEADKWLEGPPPSEKIEKFTKPPGTAALTPEGTEIGVYNEDGKILLNEAGITLLLEKAGGDKEKAREIAKEHGLVIPK